MEENTAALSATPAATHCEACYYKVAADDAFCNNCGYPLKGTEEEQRAFKANLAINEIDLQDYKDKMRKGRNSLYYVGGALFVGTLIEVGTAPDKSNAGFIIGFGAVIMGIFIALAAWSKAKPFAAMVSGASLWGVIMILNAIVNPISIIQGIVVKIIIIGLLVNGIRAAIAAEKIKKETHLT